MESGSRRVALRVSDGVSLQKVVASAGIGRHRPLCHHTVAPRRVCRLGRGAGVRRGWCVLCAPLFGHAGRVRAATRGPLYSGDDVQILVEEGNRSPQIMPPFSRRRGHHRRHHHQPEERMRSSTKAQKF